MKTKNFIKTIPLGFWVSVVGGLLVIFFTFLVFMGVWIVGYVNFEVLLYFFCLAGVIGTLYKNDNARKALMALSAIGFVFHLLNVVWLSVGMSDLGVLFLGLFASVIYFYWQPFVKAEFIKRPVSFAHAPRILLIDDDKTLLRMMSANFASKGIRILTAETGERGLAIAFRDKIDLIILDVILPKMKGREVCLSLKENSRTRDIPIIFLTVKNSEDDVRAEFEAGAISHLTKPVSFPDLYKEIQRILGNQ